MRHGRIGPHDPPGLLHQPWGKCWRAKFNSFIYKMGTPRPGEVHGSALPEAVEGVCQPDLTLLWFHWCVHHVKHSALPVTQFYSQSHSSDENTEVQGEWGTTSNTPGLHLLLRLFCPSCGSEKLPPCFPSSEEGWFKFVVAQPSPLPLWNLEVDFLQLWWNATEFFFSCGYLISVSEKRV